MAVVPFPDIMLGTALQEFPVQVVCKAECTKQLHLGRSAAWPPTLNKKADAITDTIFQLAWRTCSSSLFWHDRWN